MDEPSRSLAVVRDERARVTKEELESLREVVRNVIAPKANDDELTFFFKVCESVQLDPFKRQIYLIPRWDTRAKKEVHQPQSAIDGLRAIAQRTGKYRGQIGPFWTDREHKDADGKAIWTDVWLDPEHPPAAAKIAVLHADFDEPLWAVAVWEAYVQTYTKNEQTFLAGQWGKSGYNQLAKCAEALALRRAFPEETAGLVTVDEVQSEYEDGQATQQQEPEVIRLAAAEALASDIEPGVERNDVVEGEVEPPESSEPWDGYDTENVRTIVAKLDECQDRALVEHVQTYEAATKKRTGVITKAEYRLVEIPASEEEPAEPAVVVAAPDGEGAPGESGAAAAPPAFAPAPAPAPAEPEADELTPADRLKRACEITYERWPDQPGWEPVKVLAQAALLYEHPVNEFADLAEDEIDSIWSAIPDEVKQEVMGNGTT